MDYEVLPPFTDYQIKTFEKHQNNKLYHPYTCGNCSNIKLKMCQKYLYCPQCDYKQYHIHYIFGE